MIFKEIKAEPGVTIRISESMFLRYEKMAEDLIPVWHEIPPGPGILTSFEDGSFVSVTSDMWFVFERGQWRPMTPAEQVEATRQLYVLRSNREDHSLRP